MIPSLIHVVPTGCCQPSDNTGIEGGFPHSEISGSKPVRGSPKLIAAYHVLHRLLAPRHPPNALKTLDHSHDQCPNHTSCAVPPSRAALTKRPKSNAFASDLFCQTDPIKAAVTARATWSPRGARTQSGPFPLHDVRYRAPSLAQARELFDRLRDAADNNRMSRPVPMNRETGMRWQDQG